MVKRIIALLLLGLMAQSGDVLAALTASVDTTSVGPGEPLQLSVRSDREVSGEPDFSVLEKNFEVLDRSQSQNISIINGAMSRETAWNLTLMPRAGGEQTIPSISLAGEHTRPIKIKVSDTRTKPAAGSGDSIFIETRWDKPSAMVNEQRILTIRLYRAMDTGSSSLTEPQSDNAIIRKLAKDRVYETERNGRRYKVNERRYAVFPQSPGDLVISPVQFQGRVPSARRRQSPYSMFDDFGIDMDAFMGRGKPVRVWSPSMRLQVSDIPAGVDPDKWLPARDVQLMQRWEPTQPDFKAGEPVTRVISMLVDGQPVDQLPDLNLPLPAGIKHYPDKPVVNEQVTEDGIIAIREMRDVLVPEKNGVYHLPPVSVQWWDTQAGKMRTTKIDEQTITVSGAPASAAKSNPSATTQPTPQAATDRPVVSPADKAAASALQPSSAETGVTRGRNLWPWLSLLFALLWLVTLGIWWRTKRGAAGRPVQKSPDVEVSEKQTWQALLRSLQGGNAAEIETALVRWFDSRYPGRSISSIGHVTALLDAEQDAALIDELRKLERYRYRDDSSGVYQPRALKPLIEQWRKQQKKRKQQQSPESGLKPLYQSS
ncbi:MAG: hypothetical protein DSZ33_05045 [Gammaproteobacteria bacterium]|nr:MAG: hypothetical protein DSZ33_05045 [Gammaproteobacteria bacterium]